MSDIKTKQVSGEDTPYPVLDYFKADANALYEGGRLLWTRRDTGFAQNSTYALANPSNVICWGLITEHLDNTTGNAFGNSGLTGVPGRYNHGIFLLAGDGSISQSTLGLGVYLVSDVTGTNNGVPTVSANSVGGSRPFVGFVSTNPRGASDNPDPSKIPICVGENPMTLIPGTLVQAYADDTVLHTASFVAVPGVMSSFNFQATAATITFPAITAAIDGMRLSLVNYGTGATANVLLGNGTQNVGIVGAGTTGATAAAPASLKAQSYIANLTLGSWVPGI